MFEREEPSKGHCVGVGNFVFDSRQKDLQNYAELRIPEMDINEEHGIRRGPISSLRINGAAYEDPQNDIPLKFTFVPSEIMELYWHGKRKLL